MEQTRKNDSKADSRFLGMAAGGCKVLLYTLAAVWLVLVFLCFWRYFSISETMDRDPRTLFFGTVAMTVRCAAAALPLLAVWGVCADRARRKEQKRTNSDTDTPDSPLCAPQESGGENQGVSKAKSSVLDYGAPLSCGCLVIAAVLWIGSLFLCMGLFDHKLRSFHSTMRRFTEFTFLFAIITIPLLILRGTIVDRKRERERLRNKLGALPRDIPTSVFRVCAAVVALFWFIAALWYLWLFHYDAFADPLMAAAHDLTFWCAVVEVPLLILWRFFARRKNKTQQDRHDTQAPSGDILTAISRGCVIAVALFWVFAMSWAAWVLHFDCFRHVNILLDVGYPRLTDRFEDLTVWCAVAEVPLLILWRIFAYRQYRREVTDQRRENQDTPSGGLAEMPLPEVPDCSGTRRAEENEDFIAEAAIIEQKQKEMPKADSPFLGIAGALSRGAAVVLALFWLVVMVLPYFVDPSEGITDDVIWRTIAITYLCAIIEVPLLTVWGVCVDRKRKTARSGNHSKRDSLFLKFAKVLSWCCLVILAASSLELLLGRCEILSRAARKTIHSYTDIPGTVIMIIAFIAVPVLFIRNIYAHLKWRKEQN